MKIAAVLLAAGRSSRFGSPKLSALLKGQPVAAHAARVIAELPLAARIAVVGPDTPDLATCGFTCLPLEPAGAPMSRSVAIGVAAAVESGADAVLIALADMPLVPLDHFETLLARFDGMAIGTGIAGLAMPPAVFGGTLLSALRKLEGDAGARQLLAGAPTLELAVELGLDIDKPEDLERAVRVLETSDRTPGV